MNLIRLAQPASLDNLRLASAEPRAPGPGEVLLRVRASSLNYHDWCVVVGEIPAADGRVPMSDGAGEVLEVGPPAGDGTTAPFAKGDAVMSTFFPRWRDGPVGKDVVRSVPGDDADGFASEFVTVPASWLTRQPRGYTHAQAATLPCAALTAWRALMVDGPLVSGETVVVQGTGGVSIFALQFAKAAGATVVATSSSDEKLERLKALGADHVVEVGGAQTLSQSLRACRIGGHVSMIGVLSGREAPVSTALLMTKNIRLQGVTVGSHRHQREMVRAIEATGIVPVIDSHFPLARIADAFRHQHSGRHLGKIVLDI